MALAMAANDTDDEMNAWLSGKIKELKEPIKPCPAVRELALMLAEKDTAGKREVRIHDNSKTNIEWTTKMDKDLVLFAYYHSNLDSSMRSMEVIFFFYISFVNDKNDGCCQTGQIINLFEQIRTNETCNKKTKYSFEP